MTFVTEPEMVANQSHSEFSTQLAKTSISTSTSTFPYTRLDLNIDCIRILTLSPAEDLTSEIHCKLQHVTFAQKPKYEALSYTWGDETKNRHKISINVADFEVVENLYNALRHLRDTKEERTLWVDAICINQADVLEKNRQIAIMPFIYMRAKMVLVWLGVPEEEKPEWDWDENFNRGGLMNFFRDADKPFLMSLCENMYWKRVWIIQEIGLARKIKIGYGTYLADWGEFIRRLEFIGDVLPKKIHKQLERKYEDGHRLEVLIQSHRESLCKEPRDHIYGFVGLATDCVDGFSMGYEKSLYEVWKDVIRFKNFDNRSSQLDILGFGRLVQDLLGGKDIATPAEVADNIIPPQPTSSLHYSHHSWYEGLLRIPSRISGRILAFGPTYEEILSSTQKMVQWRSLINNHIEDEQRPNAREESVLFLQLLEDVEDDDLGKVSTFSRVVHWPAIVSENNGKPVGVWSRAPKERNWVPGEVLDTSGDGDLPVITGPNLFLLGGVKDVGKETSGKMGLAPLGARIGDYICQIHGVEKVAVVRREQSSLRIVGTAVLAENAFHARKAKEIEGKPKFGTSTVTFLADGGGLDLFVDVATAYELMG